MAHIKINDVKYEVKIQSHPIDSYWDGRNSKAITIAMTYDEALQTFVNDLEWAIVDEYENSEEIVHEIKTDMSDYSIAGPITDNRNGTITVRMGKYKQDELMLIPLTKIPQDHKEAVVWREAIEKTIQTVEDDAEALKLIPLYPSWESLIEKNHIAVNAGFRFVYKNKLYKTISPNSQFMAHWIPGQGTESLYVRIDESHVGTIEDPIPYEGNMELVNGKYYIQNDVIYLCNRDTGVAVYNALADLVGIYVAIA